MPLEKDTLQNQFRNEHHKAILNILCTHNYIVNAMNELFKNFEITRQQYNVLRILQAQHPEHATINLIKERMLDKMSDASRIVERLRLKKLVDRRECEYDKRTVEITITALGAELLEKMDSHVNELDSLLKSLSVNEVQYLNALLDKIRESELYAEKENSIESDVLATTH